MINPEQFREESAVLAKQAHTFNYTGDTGDEVEVACLRLSSVLYEIGAEILIRQDLIIQQLANIPGATTAKTMLENEK